MGIKELGAILAQKRERSPSIDEDALLFLLLNEFSIEEIPSLLNSVIDPSDPEKERFIASITQKLTQLEMADLTSLSDEEDSDEMPQLQPINHQEEEDIDDPESASNEIDDPELASLNIETTQTGTGKTFIATRLARTFGTVTFIPAAAHPSPTHGHLHYPISLGPFSREPRQSIVNPVPIRVPIANQVAELKLMALARFIELEPFSLQQLPVDIQELSHKTFKCYFCHKPRTLGQFCQLSCNHCSIKRPCILSPEFETADIDLVKSQTGKCLHRVLEALTEHKGDVVDAIIKLTVS